MTRYSYDLHIHSCLSPCADDDMTPANIAGMAAVSGLTLLALTDHNTCKNCPAFFEACKVHGIVPVAGMELTTSEEIHMICLFPGLEEAMQFDSEIDKHRMKVKNKKEIFGNQLIMNSEDDLDRADAFSLVKKYGGAAYPAHIDRESNGIIAILGSMPKDPDFRVVEYNDEQNAPEYTATYGLENKGRVVCSDAHNLWSINEAVNFIEIDDEPYSSDRVRQQLIAMLR